MLGLLAPQRTRRQVPSHSDAYQKGVRSRDWLDRHRQAFLAWWAARNGGVVECYCGRCGVRARFVDGRWVGLEVNHLAYARKTPGKRHNPLLVPFVDRAGRPLMIPLASGCHTGVTNAWRAARARGTRETMRAFHLRWLEESCCRTTGRLDRPRRWSRGGFGFRLRGVTAAAVLAVLLWAVTALEDPTRTLPAEAGRVIDLAAVLTAEALPVVLVAGAVLAVAAAARSRRHR